MALNQLEVNKRAAQLFEVPSIDAPRPRENALIAPARAIYPAKITARKYFDSEGLHRLAESLKRNGFQKPIAVRYVPGDREFESYQIITGERLFRAAQIAGIEEIPIDVYDINDGERLLRALTDNVSAEALTLEEEVETVGHLHGVEKISHSEINRSIGRGRDDKSGAVSSWSENRWRIFRAPDKVRELLNYRSDIIGHVEVIMRTYAQQSPNLQNRLIRLTRQGASVKELNTALEEYRTQQQRLTVLPPTPEKPMQSVQGTTPALSYDVQRSSAATSEQPITQDRGETIHDRAAWTHEKTDELRAIGEQSPLEIAPRPYEAPAPIDQTPHLLANAIDVLQSLHRAYTAASESDRADLRARIVDTLEDAAYRIKHDGE
jgi:ParB/RepB/Spo0J family partition protein